MGGFRFSQLEEVLLKVQALWNVTLWCWVSASRRFDGIRGPLNLLS
jgi:hypothetical protein